MRREQIPRILAEAVLRGMTEIEQLDDGCVLVKVRMYGIDASGVVSSWHLTGPKERQLKESIVKSCREAYGAEQCHPGTAD